jgi:iron complex transport system permease protein
LRRVTKTAILAAIVLLILVSLLWGRYGIEFDDPRASIVIFEIRLPRVLAAIGVATSAAMATVLFQLALRSQIAEPALFGITAFSSLGTLLTVSAGVGFGSLLAWSGAAIFSLLGVLPIALSAGTLRRLSIRQQTDLRPKLAVIGLTFGAFAVAAVGLVSFLAPDPRLRSVSLWAFGSLGLQTTSSALLILLIALAGAVVILLFSKQLERLSLGPAVIRGLGFSERKLIAIAAIAVALLSANSAFATGSIAFLGLLSATIARAVFSSELKQQLLGSSLVAVLTLLAADLISRAVAAPLELPIGLITALLGGPVMLWFLNRRPDAS